MAREHVVFHYHTIQYECLQKRGLTAIGSRQLVDGQMITDSDDRRRVAELMLELLPGNASAEGPMPQTKEHILLARR